jgi:diaminohydroxyphosphoribosylaminopyrimidine deaminase/5-amino-6-(5-phosphoribosylamino)uracil reductase
MRLNEPFIKHVTSGLPFVVLKSAMTMDGKTATSSRDSRWITNEKSRRYVHKVRAMVDAVVVGVGTVIADDPQLTARIPGGRDPLRVIVDSNLRMPLHAQVLRQESTARTLVATVSSDHARIAALEASGAEILFCDDTGGHVDLGDLLARLGSWGVQSVLLEGGHILAGEAVRCGLVDKYLMFYAPKLLAGEGIGLFAGPGVPLMSDAVRLREISLRRFDDDIMVTAYPERSCSQD